MGVGLICLSTAAGPYGGCSGNPTHTQAMLAVITVCLLWLVIGGVLSVIDIRQHRLPDRIVLPMYPVLAVVLLCVGAVSGHWPVWRAVGGAALWLVAIGSVWLLSSGRAMGFGDVKLAPLLGASLGWISWDAAVLGLMSCWILGGLWALGLLATRRVSGKDAIAFGPFMFLGMLGGVVLGLGPAAATMAV